MKAYYIWAVALILLAGCTRSHDAKRPPSTVKGVDVSHHNTISSWSSMAKAEGVSFVFVKATEGATIQDNKYRTHIRGAKKAGLMVGAYHFLTTSSSAEEQFDNFRKTVDKEDIDLIPVLDAEIMTKGHRMTSAQYVRHVRKWVNLCKRHYGKAPILYCCVGHYQRYFKGHFNDCLFWSGDVSSKRSYVDKVQWAIWQYRIGPVKGSSGKLDINMLGRGIDLKDITL